MKYVYLITEGISDVPSEKYDDKTPLELARTPSMDQLANNGVQGTWKPISATQYPGSDHGFVSMIGNDSKIVKDSGAFFELKGLGVDLKDDEVAFRVNLITVENDIVINTLCRSISNDECALFAGVFNDHFKNRFEQSEVKFYPISGFRMVMVAKESLFSNHGAKKIKTFDPRQTYREKFLNSIPKGKGSDILHDIVDECSNLLKQHEINQIKIDLSEDPANSIWIWGQKRPKQMKTFKELFNLSAFCVPSSQLIRGVAAIAGMDTSHVIGSHLNYHDSIKKRVDVAMKAIYGYDVVIMHFEAINDVSKMGDLHKKCQCIEFIDEHVVKKLSQFLKIHFEQHRLFITSSHAERIDLRKPSRTSVPWLLYGQGVNQDKTEHFSEKQASKGLFKSTSVKKILKTVFKSTIS